MCVHACIAHPQRPFWVRQNKTPAHTQRPSPVTNHLPLVAQSTVSQELTSFDITYDDLSLAVGWMNVSLATPVFAWLAQPFLGSGLIRGLETRSFGRGIEQYVSSACNSFASSQSDGENRAGGGWGHRNISPQALCVNIYFVFICVFDAISFVGAVLLSGRDCHGNASWLRWLCHTALCFFLVSSLSSTGARTCFKHGLIDLIPVTV